jgi:hypothetical protein
MKYPHVADEFETLDRVLSGKSIARYGDGEFNLVRGGNCVSQRVVSGIQRELQQILRTPSDDLLVGVPRLDARSPKYRNWLRLAPHMALHLRDNVRYYSAFITRPDSAPWIATDEYFAKVESLWAGKHVTMVYGSKRSLSADFPALASASAISVVECDYAHTYPRIDELEDSIVEAGNKVVLLMCGPTATCLAARLSRRGFHAVDLGHIGMWWMPHKNPKLTAQLQYRG